MRAGERVNLTESLRQAPEPREPERAGPSGAVGARVAKASPSAWRLRGLLLRKPHQFGTRPVELVVMCYCCGQLTSQTNGGGGREGGCEREAAQEKVGSRQSAAAAAAAPAARAICLVRLPALLGVVVLLSPRLCLARPGRGRGESEIELSQLEPPPPPPPLTIAPGATNGKLILTPDKRNFLTCTTRELSPLAPRHHSRRRRHSRCAHEARDWMRLDDSDGRPAGDDK